MFLAVYAVGIQMQLRVNTFSRRIWNSIWNFIFIYLHVIKLNVYFSKWENFILCMTFQFLITIDTHCEWSIAYLEQRCEWRILLYRNNTRAVVLIFIFDIVLPLHLLHADVSIYSILQYFYRMNDFNGIDEEIS